MIRDPYLAAEWERCWPMLEPAVALAGGTHDKALLESDIDEGAAQFWPGPDYALVTSVVTHRTGLRDCIVLFGGGSLEPMRHLRAPIERFGREHGCKRLLIYGRRPWLRVFPGLKELMTVMAEDL